jgi:hypothetical protein
MIRLADTYCSPARAKIGYLSERTRRSASSARFPLKVLPVDCVFQPWPDGAVTLKRQTPSPVVQTFARGSIPARCSRCCTAARISAACTSRAASCRSRIFRGFDNQAVADAAGRLACPSHQPRSTVSPISEEGQDALRGSWSPATEFVIVVSSRAAARSFFMGAEPRLAR